jgi:TonB family protein
MPSDPAGLLALTAKKNGLQNIESVPWHLKGTYQVLDRSGTVSGTGAFEILWMSEKKNIWKYTTAGTSKTIFTTEKGAFRVGTAGWGDAAYLIESSLAPRFHAGKIRDHAAVKGMAASATLRCIALSGETAGVEVDLATYCIGPSSPILRYSETSEQAYETSYNKITSIAGTYVAREVSVSRLGRPLLKINVTSVESLRSVDENIFVPPSTATALRGKLDESRQKVLHTVAPQYPQIAEVSHIQGIVVVQVVVGKDGKVIDLRAISGNPQYWPAAIDAVRQWVYEPFRADGGGSQCPSSILNV